MAPPLLLAPPPSISFSDGLQDTSNLQDAGEGGGEGGVKNGKVQFP